MKGAPGPEPQAMAGMGHSIGEGQAAGRYLSGLTASLAAGLESLPAGFRSRHSDYLRSAQRPDGGFAGRRGGSDIYYTMFALRSAELLRPADEDLWDSAERYVRGLFAPPRDMIECFSLLYLQRLVAERAGAERGNKDRAEIAAAVARSRTADGGYARFPGGEATLYHTFLAALCAELIGAVFSGGREAAAFAQSRRCADGGYADSAADGGEGATNSTAAALALLELFGAPAHRNPSTVPGAIEFLASMQRPDGGFATCAGAPEADLLSTFSASVGLAGIGALSRVKLAPIARFAQDLQARDGGFRGCARDDAPDAEYTYYGLATLALLAGLAAKTPMPNLLVRRP